MSEIHQLLVFGVMLLPSWCPPYSPLKNDPVTDEPVFCICKQPDTGTLMLGCDGCDDWYHFTCVRIPVQCQGLILHYYCPYCQQKSEKNRSQWKRKCRVDHCYEPCVTKSKYCSKEHGKLFISTMINQVNQDPLKSEILQQMQKLKSVEDIQKYGDKDFILRDIKRDTNPELYDSLIASDLQLKSLEEQTLDTNEKIPVIKQKIENLNSYIDWLNKLKRYISQVDEPDGQDNETQSNTNSKKKNKRGKKKKTKKLVNICGYFNQCVETNMDIPIESFADKYEQLMSNPQEDDTIDGICVKSRCIRHTGWAGMESDKYNIQLEALETNLERIELLKKTRKQQLHIAFYEQLKLAN